MLPYIFSDDFTKTFTALSYTAQILLLAFAIASAALLYKVIRIINCKDPVKVNENIKSIKIFFICEIVFVFIASALFFASAIVYSNDVKSPAQAVMNEANNSINVTTFITAQFSVALVGAIVLIPGIVVTDQLNSWRKYVA